MKKTIRKLAGLMMAGALFTYMPAVAMAERYDVTNRDSNIVIVATVDGNGQTIYKVNDVLDNSQIVIYGSTDSTSGTNVVINSGAGAKAVIVFEELTIVKSRRNYNAAVTTTGEGDVTIELDGNSIVRSGKERAGIQKENAGLLTIKDGNDTPGSLEAKGGDYGAGIGGAFDQSVDNIVIEGGKVTATGGSQATGIGGGYGGSGTVTITGGEVTATGGENAAGIGGGYEGSGTVTITGGEVTAVGVCRGAGIGGGCEGLGTVTITGGTVVATSDLSGAGIGGGVYSTGSTITISGSANVYASGGEEGFCDGKGAAIGEGGRSDFDNNLVDGTESYDASGLYTTGSITTYPAGTTVEQITKKQVLGTTIRGTVPDPNASIDDKKEETQKDQLTVEKPETEEPKVEEPPVYTERSCIADVDVAALIAALLKNNPNATVLDIEFDDNICLTPELMTALFADNRVAKNCYFWYEGKRYVLHIGPVNKQSPLYAADFAMLAKEPDGLAGFMMMARIFANLGVTMAEVK